MAIVAHVYARRTLEAGFTTVRDVGAPEFIDVALRNAINAGTSVRASHAGGDADRAQPAACGHHGLLTLHQVRPVLGIADGVTRFASWCASR